MLIPSLKPGLWGEWLGQTWQSFVCSDRSLLFVKSSGRPLERFDQEEACSLASEIENRGGGVGVTEAGPSACSASQLSHGGNIAYEVVAVQMGSWKLLGGGGVKR